MSQEPGIRWTLSAFDELKPHALYAVLQLRAEVFVVEQNCAFQDLDGADPLAMHLQGYVGDALVAYARCFAPGVKFAESSIGRIVTRDGVRGTGIGHVLVECAMASVSGLWGRQAIRIGAQARLTRFYEGHGFHDAGVPYIEDGIDHLEMLWHPPALTTEAPNTLERT
jgi:ElaA protein